MRNRLLLVLVAIVIGGCAEEALPGGYTLVKSATNREWLRDPNGVIVPPGLVKGLYEKGDRILLVAHAASAGGQPLPPTPIDDTCFVALSINTAERQVTQISIAEASNMARDMTEILSTNRGCI